MPQNNSEGDGFNLSDATPKRIDHLNLDSLTEDQLEEILRTERHLSRLRVKDLHVIARDACGPGTWISHAKKDQLKEGILKGHPPLSAQVKDQAGRRPDSENGEEITKEESSSTEYAEPVAEGMVQIMMRLARKTVKGEVPPMMIERLRRIEEELGLEPPEEMVDEQSSSERAIEVLEEQIEKSEDAQERLKNKVDESNHE